MRNGIIYITTSRTSGSTPEEAALAYNKKAIELWGEGNCYLNKVGK